MEVDVVIARENTGVRSEVDRTLSRRQPWKMSASRALIHREDVKLDPPNSMVTRHTRSGRCSVRKYGKL